jgi:hypothetical protein
MLIVRGTLIFILSLLALLLVWAELRSPNPNLGSALVVLAGVFVLLILILGPFWPNARRTDKFKAYLSEVLGVRDATKIIAFTVVAIATFVLAWDRYADPMQEIHTLERLIALAVGRAALPGVEVAIGIYFMWKAFDEYAKARRDGKKAA